MERTPDFTPRYHEALSRRWIAAERACAERNARRIYPLSMECHVGRDATHRLFDAGGRDVRVPTLDPAELLERERGEAEGDEPSRWAACFPESSMALSEIGYGLRYDYGIFKQFIAEGWPRCSRFEDEEEDERERSLGCCGPRETACPDERVEVALGCSFEVRAGSLNVVPGRRSMLIGVPFDHSVAVGSVGTTGTLRLWAAATPEYFDFARYSSGGLAVALADSPAAETLTRVFYADDSTTQGQGLRFLQEYFLVACSLADLLRRFRRAGNDWRALPEQAAIRLNDTHPALAVSELMRLLLDVGRLGWGDAWDLTQRTLACTSHPLLIEALEKWPVPWFEHFLPRQLEIIYEINLRFLDDP